MSRFTVLESSSEASTDPFMIVDEPSKEPTFDDDHHVQETDHGAGPVDVEEILGGHFYTLYLPTTGTLMHVAQKGSINSALCWYAHKRGTRSPHELRSVRGKRAVIEQRSSAAAASSALIPALPLPKSVLPLASVVFSWRSLLKIAAAVGAYAAIRFYAADSPPVAI